MNEKGTKRGEIAGLHPKHVKMLQETGVIPELQGTPPGLTNTSSRLSELCYLLSWTLYTILIPAGRKEHR